LRGREGRREGKRARGREGKREGKPHLWDKIVKTRQEGFGLLLDGVSQAELMEEGQRERKER
jgi:hypothetical protein